MNYTSADEEDIAIQVYARSHPFPSYKAMLKRMENNVQVWAEYGVHNHEALKQCYEHITNKEVCQAAGRTIHARGGEQAMAMNYYALLNYGPFRESRDPVIRNAPTYLNGWWDGIGHWMA